MATHKNARPPVLTFAERDRRWASVRALMKERKMDILVVAGFRARGLSRLGRENGGSIKGSAMMVPLACDTPRPPVQFGSGRTASGARRLPRLSARNS